MCLPLLSAAVLMVFKIRNCWMDQENLLDSSLAIPLDLDVHLTEGRIIQLSHLFFITSHNNLVPETNMFLNNFFFFLITKALGVYCRNWMELENESNLLRLDTVVNKYCSVHNLTSQKWSPVTFSFCLFILVWFYKDHALCTVLYLGLKFNNV